MRESAYRSRRLEGKYRVKGLWEVELDGKTFLEGHGDLYTD
jgi:hypothetical protein